MRDLNEEPDELRNALAGLAASLNLERQRLIAARSLRRDEGRERSAARPMRFPLKGRKGRSKAPKSQWVHAAMDERAMVWHGLATIRPRLLKKWRFGRMNGR